MLRIIKQVFCIHVWEYGSDYNDDPIKECRKCGKISVISLAIGKLVVEDWQSLNAKLHSLSILLGLFYD